MTGETKEGAGTVPVEPGSERWNELVRVGIMKISERNWFLGDAALEIAPMGDGSAHNGSEAKLRRYADEVGVEYGSLQVYRKVAAAWHPVNRVTGVGWKVHSQLMGRQELIRPGMTVSQAATALGQRNVGRTGPRSSPDARAEAVKDYLADPEVAEAAFSDPELLSQVREQLQRPEVADAITRGDEDGKVFRVIRESRVRAGVPYLGHQESSKPKSGERPSAERIRHLDVIADKAAGTINKFMGPGEELTETLEVIAPEAEFMNAHARQRLVQACAGLAARAGHWEDVIRGIAGRQVDTDAWTEERQAK